MLFLSDPGLETGPPASTLLLKRLPGVTMDEKRPSRLSWPSGVFRRYFGDSEPQDASRRTLEIRGMVRHQKKKHRKVFWRSIGVLAVAVAGLGATLFVQAKRLEQQRGAAADLFYAMKEMELEVGRLQLAAPEREEYGARRERLREQYESFLERLHVYGEGVPEEEQIIRRTIGRLGEAELLVSEAFIADVKRHIERWRRDDRLEKAMRLAEENGYYQRIGRTMLEHGVPAEFFFLAVQESDLKTEAVGRSTRFGIAKGMWQFMPATARSYDLKIGPLSGVRRADPSDERHDFEKSTRAAARFLHDLYLSDAQASGLLAIASYNWGSTRVLRLVRSLPEAPAERNYWTLLERYGDQIPTETRIYVLNIVAAAAIATDPALFGFDFPRPSLEPPVAVDGVGRRGGN